MAINSPAVVTAAPSYLRPIIRVAPFLLFVALTSAIAAPRAVMISFVALALLPIVAVFLSRRFDRLAALDGRLVAAVAAFGLYITINALWSVAPNEAFGKVACFWFIFVVAVAASIGWPDVESDLLARVAKALVLAVFVGSVFLVIEVLWNEPIQRFIYSIAAGTRAASKHIRVEDGWVTDIASYVLNRNIAVLNFALWPALLMLSKLLPRRPALLIGSGLAATAAIATFASQHETSMLSFLFALAALIGMWLAPVLMRRAVVIGWIVATLLVVPIALASYSAGLHMAQVIPETGRNRIILWGFTAQQVVKAPILGVGLASTKTLDDRAEATAEWPDGFSYPLRTGRHSHNIFMQTWYELGAVGALLLLGVGLAILRVLARQPARVQPFAYASFVSAVLLGSFSWGMWQTWFMASFGLWALLLGGAFELVKERPSQAGN